MSQYFTFNVREHHGNVFYYSTAKTQLYQYLYLCSKVTILNFFITVVAYISIKNALCIPFSFLTQPFFNLSPVAG